MSNEILIDSYPFKNYWSKSGKVLRNGVIREPKYSLLLAFLVEKYKFCFHCKRPVKIYPYVNGVGLKSDSATVDHLTPRPYRYKHEKVEKVLACYQCNNDRNSLAQRKLKELSNEK